MGRKWSIVLAVCCGLLWSLCIPAAAVVLSTSEPTGGENCVYVVGNPDWYPVEYYDREANCYRGILPDLLEQISQRTGLNFTYICAGEEDQRLRLARNGQAELVSGCILNEQELSDQGMTASRTVLTLPGENGEVCFAFTNIAPDSLVAAVEGALDGMTETELAGTAVEFLAESTRPVYPRWLLPGAAGVVALLLAAVILLALRVRKYKQAIQRDERYDPITGFGNKVYFSEQFERRIPDNSRGIYCVVLLGFDIVRVNQYYGEEAVEEQLLFAESQLLETIGEHEFAARISGGGFAVARPSGGEREASEWTEKMLARLNRFGERYGKDYHPDFRAGIYMLGPEDRSAEVVLLKAQQGYRTAVERGADYAFARQEMIEREQENLRLKKQTVDAIQNREFKMFLQFIVRAEDGRIKGAEALSRWEHPQRGQLYPGSYIGLMEAEDTISELDFYMFEEACKQLEKWGREGRPLSISCNFTRRTIDQENFTSRLREIAGRYFFDYACLTIEITEDMMANNRSSALANVSKCKELGFRIALDDAGNGFTSFADLRDYPIDIVKIDRSILNATVAPRGVALLRGMIALVHSLGMETLCEGVETKEQADLVRNLGADFIQGYYYYRAIPKEEADRYLNGEGAELCGSGACTAL